MPRRTLLLLLLALPAVPARPDDAAALAARARAAYQAHDLPAFLEASRAASAAAPRRLSLLYNLACAHALNAQPAEAVAVLARLARMGAAFDLDRDPDLASLQGRQDFAEVRARMAALRQPLVRSTEAFRLAERDLLTEGIAHDPRTGRFFLGSVRQRKIVAVDRDGHARDFVPAGRDGLLAVLGLRADPERRLLWACSAGTAPMAGLVPADDGRAALYAFDLDSGALRRKVEVTGEGSHNLNDLTVDAAGRVYASDPGVGSVLALDPGAAALRTLVPPGTMPSPQGLALSPDGRWLFVADYARGLARVDPGTGALTWLDWPEDALATGIDGLVAVPGGLLAIQNGVAPARLTRITVSADGTRVTATEVVERAHPLYAEPTLGVLAGEAFYYVATSQWPAYEDPAHPPAPETLKDSLVLRLPWP